MRKATAIFLLFILLIQITALYPILEMNRWLIKREMTCRIIHPVEKLAILRIDSPGKDPDFTWIDESEFIYQDKMYDIVRIEYQGSQAVIHCIQDDREELMFRQMNNMMKDQNPCSLTQVFPPDFLITYPLSVAGTEGVDIKFPEPVLFHTSRAPLPGEIPPKIS